MRLGWWILTLILGGLLIGVACDEDDPITEQDGGVTPTLGGACLPSEEVGEFNVEHTLDYSSVSGRIRDGVVPGEVPQLDNEAGGCKLWHQINPVCDPSCPSGETCDYDGTCIPYPETKDVGSVTILGLTKDVTIEPPTYFDTEMPDPPFTPGQGIKLDTTGVDYPAFTLYGSGVTPIEVTGDKWVITEHEDLDLFWVSANDPHAYREISINIDQHGVSPITMVCKFEDTGSATVPAVLIDEFIANGTTGYSTVHVYRKTSDSIQLDHGCVDLEVYSRITGDLEVEGHIPCTGPNDCPEGMTCDLQTQTCV